MPAKSKSQQRLFGMVHAYQKGELENPSDEIKDIAKSISKKDAEDFAETKHKGLPNKVKKTKKVTESQLREIISESLKKILEEGIYSAPSYYWTISRQNEEEETLECLYGAYSPGEEWNAPKSFDENGFTSPNTAYRYGMRYLKAHIEEFGEGYYCLEVADEETGNIVKYTTIKNGKITPVF